MAAIQNRQILLASRPTGSIKDECFEFRTVTMPEVGDGEVLVRNLYLSLDPAMRGWMREADSYIEPVKLGDVMRGSTIGQVVESKHAEYKPGDLTFGMGGWQEYTVAKPDGRYRKLPPGAPFPLTWFLSVLGVTGLTAYFGLLDVGKPKKGDTLVVSTAAGAVGSIVGQIGKILGCRVIGIAGSAEKCRWVTEELGFDGAINYKKQDVGKELRALCPDKIDIYFDNVGGDILNECLGLLNVHARVVICGAITMYNAVDAQPGPSNYITLLTKRSTMQGFVVIDYLHRFSEGITALAEWVGEGKLKHREDVVEGLENAPKAIHKLFDGSNQGKLIIKIAEPA